MPTTFKELKRLVMLNLNPRTDGITLMAAEQGINDAQKVIACVKDFDELMTLDTTNAVTVADTKLYHVENDLNLVRPKDIYSIRLMDTDSSRKLEYVPFRQLDERVPYTEQTGTGRSNYYTVRGKKVEFYKIPDDSYRLYVQHSQWPTVLSADATEIEYENIDHVIVSLATEMAESSLEGGTSDWLSKATQLLGISTNEEATRPDRMFVAQPFCASGFPHRGEYWNNPWVKRQP